MEVLKFKVSGTSITRKNTGYVTINSRNEVYASFEFDSTWGNIEPRVANFRNGDTSYDVFIEEGRCVVPYEVLEKEGQLKVCVMGGDLISTGCVEVAIYNNGVVGGLVPTIASPSVY